MKFVDTEVWGFKHALKGMRNPMNSWEKSDSGICKGGDDGIGCNNCAIQHRCNHPYDKEFKIGKDDMKLAQSLIIAGNEHGKFMRMIHVAVDTDMPRYWWAEADCYKFGSKNSCSTMHTIMKREITIDDFCVPQIIKEILHKSDKEKKQYAFKCELPKGVELESKIYSINGYDYEVFNNGEIYSMPKDVVDSIGRIRHYDRKKMLIGQNSGEYFSVRLGGRNGGKLVPIHKLLAQLFIYNDLPNEKFEVNHKDGDKGNCSLDNLEWCTPSENNQHAFDTGLKEVSLYAKYKAYILNRKVSLLDIEKIKEMYKSGMTQKEIASKFDMKQAQISEILRGNINEMSDDFEEAYTYELIINRLNELREMYLNTKDYYYVIRMKRLLPEGFLQLRTWDTNYAELRNMYFQRRSHRLKEEWIDTFCKWIESLPYAEELIMYEGENKQ